MLLLRQQVSLNNALQNSDDADTSPLELALVTAALVTSASLAVAGIFRARVTTFAAATSPALKIPSLGLMIAALLLLIASLVLGWLREISLDAFTAIIFAISPALISFPHRVIKDVYLRFTSNDIHSLYIAPSSYRYVRLGMSCGRDPFSTQWRDHFECCEGPDCRARHFVRALPKAPSILSRVISRLHAIATTTATEGTASPETSQWHGTRIGHSQHCVILRDVEVGLKSSWRTGIVSSIDIVSNPSLVKLNNPRRVLQGLLLLSDIVAIGDLVLQKRRHYVREQITVNNGVQHASSATPAAVYNAILDSVGLNEWGRISADVANSNFVDSYPENRRRAYGLLFFLLTEKSKMYATEQVVEVSLLQTNAESLSDDEQGLLGYGVSRLQVEQVGRVSADSIINNLLQFRGSQEQFEACLLGLVGRWLISWGCLERSLRHVHDRNRETAEFLPDSFIPHCRAHSSRTTACCGKREGLGIAILGTLW